MFEKSAAVGSEDLAAGMLTSWRRTAHRYRQVLFAGLNKNASKKEVAENTLQLTESEALRCRVRYFIDGLAIGSKGWIDDTFGMSRNHFSENRTSGARKMRRIRSSLCTLRDLQVDPLTSG